MKTALKLILLIGIVGYLVYAVVRFSQQTEEIVCEGVDIEVSDTLMGFITKDDVYAILAQHKVHAQGRKISEINLTEIEQLIETNPYISEAHTYCTGQGVLRIRVVPQHPVLHVMPQNAESYYLDESGAIMPVGAINADLCVATGKISQKFAKEKLLPLAQHIYADPFWGKLAEQIHVVDENNIEICPRVGQHVIQLGNITDFREKLERVRLFYKEGLSKVGWNKYKAISVAFDGQVVCIKKESKIK